MLKSGCKNYFFKAKPEKFNCIRNGFSMVEVMIALAIIAVVTVGVLTLLASAFRANILLRNTIIASALAEEGIELVRAVRDGNWLEGKTFDGVGCFLGTTEWREGLCSGQYVIDYSEDLTAQFDNIYVTGNDFLCRDSVSGRFIRNDGNFCPIGSVSTQFRRQIVITNATVDEFIADVYVYWCKRGVQPCLSTQENFLRVEEKFRNWFGT